MKHKMRNIASVITSVATIATMSGIGSLVPYVANAAIVDGDLIRATGTFDIYIVKLVGSEMYRRLILNPDIFEQYGHLKWSNVQDVDQAVVNQYTDSQLVRMDGDTAVYQLVPTGEDTAAKHHVASVDDFLAGGFDWDQIYVINAHEHDNTTTGANYAPPSTPPVTAEAFEVKVSSATPAASTVALGVIAQPWTKFDFMAGSESVTVSSILVTKSGLHDTTDVKDVRLYEGSTQVGGTQAFNTTTNQASFSGLSWTIPANSTKVLTVSLSINTAANNGTAGNTVVVGINTASNITATKSATGTFPINGKSHTLAAAGVGVLTVAQNSLGDSTVISGATHQQLGSWKLTADATESINVTKIAITNNGSATDNDVSNLTLEYSGSVIKTVASMTNSKFTFDLSASPFSIPVNTTRTVTVYGDLASGITTSRTVRLTINLAQDLKGVGATTSGALESSTTHPMPTSANENIMTIGQGTYSFAIYAATNPSAQNYVKGTTQRLFTALQFSASANEGVRVTELKLTKQTAVACADTSLANVTLYDYDTATGTETQVGSSTGVIGGTVTFGTNTVNAFDSTGLFDVPKSGNKYIHARVDIPTGATTNNDCGLSIAALADVKADGLDSQNDLASATTAVSTGNKHTVTAAGTLTAALNGLSPSSSTVYSAGQKGVVFSKYDLTAGSGEDIQVSSIQFDMFEVTHTGAETDAFDSGDVTNVKLMKGDTQLGTTIASPTGSVTFSPQLTVPAGTTVTLSLVVDWPSSGYTYTTATALHTDLDVSEFSVAGAASGATSGIVSGSDVNSNEITVTTGSLVSALVQPPVSGNIIKGSTQVEFLKMIFTAGVAESVRVTSVKLEAEGDVSSGDATALTNALLIADISQVGLYVESTPGSGTFNTLLDTKRDIDSGDDVTFIGLQIDVSAGGQRAALVKANVLAGAVSAHQLWLKVDAAANVTATGLSSNSAIVPTGTPNDLGDDTDGTVTMTVAAAGALTIAAAAADSETSSRIVLAGATNEVFHKVKFSASVDEAIVLAKVRICSDPDADGTCDGADDAGVISVSVWDGSTQVGSGTLSSGIVDITLSPLVTVPAGGYKVLTIKGNLVAATSLVSGSTPMNSGDTPQLGVAAGMEDTTWGTTKYGASDTGGTVTCHATNGCYNVGAVGAQSGATITTSAGANANLLGLAMTLRKTTPTLSLTPGWSPGAVTVGDFTQVIKFRATANANQDLDIYRLTFAIGTTDNGTTAWNECDAGATFQAANFNIYDATDMNTPLDVAADWAMIATGGTTECGDAADEDIGFLRWSPATVPSVGAGMSRDFVLTIDTSNTANPTGGTNFDYLGATVKADTAAYADSAELTAYNAHQMLWQDGAVSSHISGYQVKNLDLAGGSNHF